MGFFKPFIGLLPMAGLLLMEPDFGATVVMMGAAAAMLFLGGVGLFRFTLMVALAVGAVTVLVQAQPYRMARLITFTAPWADQFGSGYQLTPALIDRKSGVSGKSVAVRVELVGRLVIKNKITADNTATPIKHITT